MAEGAHGRGERRPGPAGVAAVQREPAQPAQHERLPEAVAGAGAQGVRLLQDRLGEVGLAGAQQGGPDLAQHLRLLHRRAHRPGQPQRLAQPGLALAVLALGVVDQAEHPQGVVARAHVAVPVAQAQAAPVPAGGLAVLSAFAAQLADLVVRHALGQRVPARAGQADGLEEQPGGGRPGAGDPLGLAEQDQRVGAPAGIAGTGERRVGRRRVPPQLAEVALVGSGGAVREVAAEDGTAA